jgi:hypothetical protein
MLLKPAPSDWRELRLYPMGLVLEWAEQEMAA